MLKPSSFIKNTENLPTITNSMEFVAKTWNRNNPFLFYMAIGI